MRASLLLLTAFIHLVCAESDDVDADNTILRWASAGGGWRSMALNMGIANIFAQAGLFGDESSSSQFTALSMQSGAAWFATQFLYSQPFYNATINSTPQELSQFMVDWMGFYRKYTATLPQGPAKENKDCKFLGVLALALDAEVANAVIDNCAMFVELKGSWADFNHGLLATVSAGYGDPDFVTRALTRENRIAPLSSTDMYLQLTLAVNSRIRGTSKDEKDTGMVSYLGPKDERNIMYTVPIAVQWSVADTYASYISNTPNGTGFPSGMVTYHDAAPKKFKLADWEDTFLFPAENGKVFMDVPSTASSGSTVREPFGGRPPTVAQITGGSSAGPGYFSSLNPTTYAQTASGVAFEAAAGLGEKEGVSKLVNGAIETLVADPFYQSTFFDQLSVCSQWPDEACDESDVRFLDGFAVDSPTVALSIGQLQTIQNCDPSKTIKLILSPDNNFLNDGQIRDDGYLMAYFSTKFNQDVAPGDFLWPSTNFFAPMRSPQIFAEYFDLDVYKSLLDPVDDIEPGLSTARIQATTINNPAFLVKEGQSVDIFIIQDLTDLPFMIFGLEEIDRNTQPLGDLVRGIASSSALLKRVQNFLST